MEGRYMSDKYTKHDRGADLAKDNLMMNKAAREQTLCEERYAKRLFNREETTKQEGSENDNG